MLFCMLPQVFVFYVCQPWDTGYLSRYNEKATGCMTLCSNPGMSILAVTSTQLPVPMSSFAGGRASGADVGHSPLHLSPRLRISGYIHLLRLHVSLAWAVETLHFNPLPVKDIFNQTNQMVGRICPAMTAKCYESRTCLKTDHVRVSDN
jgi:hypothetical protein